jgi:hypothetical protein
VDLLPFSSRNIPACSYTFLYTIACGNAHEAVWKRYVVADNYSGNAVRKYPELSGEIRKASYDAFNSSFETGYV